VNVTEGGQAVVAGDKVTSRARGTAEKRRRGDGQRWAMNPLCASFCRGFWSVYFFAVGANVGRNAKSWNYL